MARDPLSALAGEDAARETDDAATAAAVAAAGAELDAFLASDANAPGTRDEDGSSETTDSTRRIERARRSEEAFAEVLARRDRAKTAIGELSRRVEDVQRELNALDEEEDLELEAREEEEEEEETRASSLAATPRGDGDDGDDGDDDDDDDHWPEHAATDTTADARRRRVADLAAARDDAAARLSCERRELARLVPEMQRARREMHEADREVSLGGTFDGRASADAAADRRRRARAKTASASADARADRRVFAIDSESPERREARLALRREKRSAHARARDAHAEPARASRRAARERLREKLALIQAAVSDAQRFEKTKHEDDVRRLLELKRSTDAVFSRVSRAVAAKKAARDKKARRRAEEAAALLARGENPRLAFRRRDRLAEATREARERRDAHESRLAEIKRRLAREARELDRRERAAEKAKRAETYFKEGAKALQRRDTARLSGRAPKSARDAKALRHPDAAPLESLLTTREMALREKYPLGSPGKDAFPERDSRGGDLVGVASPSAEREPGWNSPAAAVGAAGNETRRTGGATTFLTRDDDDDETARSVDAALTASEDGVALDALDAAEAAERRARAKKIADIENARLLAVAARRAADPGRLYRKQVTCGRVFEGDAFAPSPRVVAFDDFVVGKKYTKHVTLTNVSYAASTFRVLPFEDHAHATALRVSYEQPGKMSAGMSAVVRVAFAPTAAVPIDAYVPLSTPAGVVRVPIECRPRIADVRVVRPDLDFGEVVTGERATLVAELRNEGAAATPFTLTSGDDEDSLEDSRAFEARVRGAGRVREDGTAVSAATGVVPGYGSVFVDVAYAPVAAKPSVGRRFVELGSLSGDEKTRTSSERAPPRPATRLAMYFRGAGVPPPVHLGGRNVVDFKTVALGCAYRDILEVRNRGRVAARVSLKPPDALLGALEIVPDACFVQPGSFSRFSLKFKPDERLAARFANRERAFGDRADEPEEARGVAGVDGATTTSSRENGGAAPMEVSVTAACEARVRGREHPVPFAFKATLTRGDVRFDPPSLDFGDVRLGERAVLTLRVTNSGALSQKFGVCGPTRREMDESEGDVSVTPSRYGELLGGETVELEVGFAPRVVGERVFCLTLKSLLGAREWRVPCTGWGARPCVVFENGGNVLTLPPTAPREASSGSVFLRNANETTETTFEICVPAAARRRGLSAAPHVATLAPGERKRVRFEFCPPEETSPDSASAAVPEPEAEDGVAAKDFVADARPESFRLAMFVKTRRATRASGDSEGAEDDATETRVTQHIEVRTATHAPAIRVLHLPEHGNEPASGAAGAGKDAKDDEDEDEGPNAAPEPRPTRRGERAFLLDFGAVAVGVGTTRHVEVRNESGETVSISPSQLDHEGVFSALAAFRPIPPGAVARVPVAFRPRRETAHEDVFVLRTPVGNARVVLRGEGVDLRADVVVRRPALGGDDDETEPGNETFTNPKAPPSDAARALPVVDCGDCVFGASCTTTATIRNPTRAPFAWHASFAAGSVVAPGAGGTNRAPFVVSPAGGVLPPGGEAETAVTFSPHGAAILGRSPRGLALSDCRAVLEVATTSVEGGRGGAAAAAPSVAARRVVGRCWGEGAYAFAEEPDPNPTDDGFGKDEAWLAADGRPALGDALRTPAGAPGADAEDADAEDAAEKIPHASVVATAREPARFGGAPVSARVVIGSAVGPEGGADVTYAIGVPEPATYGADDGGGAIQAESRAGWTLSSESGAGASGTVASGARVAATFAFAPPAEAPKAGDLAFFGLEEWVEATSVVSLKGGDPAPPGGERIVAVRLRCRLLPPAPEAKTFADAEGTETEKTEETETVRGGDGAGDAVTEPNEGDAL